MSPLRVPTINAHAFLKTMVARQAQRKVVEFLDGLGPDRVRFMVEQRTGFEAIALGAWGADKLADLKVQAKRLVFMAEWYSDDEVLGWLPDWTQRLMAELDEDKRAWLRQEFLWLRALFVGSNQREDQGGPGWPKIKT